MAKKPRQTALVVARPDSYHAILAEVVGLLETARRASARAVNAVMVSTYWQIGRRIVESEMRGKHRADYGEQLIDRLSADLTARFKRGFSRRAVYQMRAFYQNYPPLVQSPSAQSAREPIPAIMQSTIAQSSSVKTPRFVLPWSHYVRLLSVENADARQFYETETLRGGWTVKQLDRQIGAQFYERAAISRNKAAMLTKHTHRQPTDAVTADEEVKDPFLLEFLDLKDEYSETQLEEALILKLETFLLELGNDFAFVGRQRRLRVDDTWYRVDLLLFHRRLRCLVIVDLKISEFTHADAGQMHLYCNYAKEHWTHPDENPPVGLILCTRRDDAVAHYSLDGLPNKVMAAQYKTALPDEKMLVAELEKSRKLLESRVRTQRRL
jgi:predicted nuclease of restriction endonuclease-like (RecB) superfamily